MSIIAPQIPNFNSVTRLFPQFRSPFIQQTILLSDTNSPFEYQTCLVTESPRYLSFSEQETTAMEELGKSQPWILNVQRSLLPELVVDLEAVRQVLLLRGL